MLIQIIACCLFVIKPLSEPMMTWALTNKYYSQWLVQSRAMSRRFESKHCVHMDRNCTRNILLLLRLIGSTGNHKNIFYIQNAIELRINHICLTFFTFYSIGQLFHHPEQMAARCHATKRSTFCKRRFQMHLLECWNFTYVSRKYLQNWQYPNTD